MHTNQKHPFLTIEKGFLPVGQIAVGMHVRRADGKIGVITGWKVVPGARTMYNLEVAQDHTFTVGDGQWVVHNCTSPEELAQTAEDFRVEKGANVGAASNVKWKGTGDNVVAHSGSPVSRIGGNTDIARARYGGCCAETNLYAKIADGLANGKMFVDDSITIVESAWDGRAPCGDCRANAQILANQTGYSVDLYYFNPDNVTTHIGSYNP